jgi:hypothetical protein
MVPPGWEHPKTANGRFIPLYGRSFAKDAARWDAEKAKWAAGEFPKYASADSRKLSFEEWDGQRPRPENYMPDWPSEELTHLQMYENTSEGTPISPVMASPEQLARWLADNNASAFGPMKATYEEWLRVCRGGYAPSMVVTDGIISSGVSGLSAEHHE